MLRILGITGLWMLTSLSWGQKELSDYDIGLRVGQDFGVSSFGLFAEYDTDKDQTIQFAFSSIEEQSKISTIYIFPSEEEVFETEGLTYSYGAGPSYTFGSGTTMYGIEGFGGLNFKIPDVPFGVRLDWRPGIYSVGGNLETRLQQFGFNVLVYIDEF